MKYQSFKLAGFGLFTYVFATTIGFASVNAFTLSIIPLARVVAATICMIVMFAYLLNGKVKLTFILTLLIILLCYALGTFLGLDSITHYGVEQDIIISFALVTVGAMYFIHADAEEAQYIVAKYFFWTSLAIVLILLATGGIVFDPIPGFVIEITSRDGDYLRYSQGISKFFGMACITSIWMLTRSNERVWGLFLLMTSFLFLILSFLGGGRGDILAAAVISSLILISKSRRSFLLLFLIVVVLIAVVSWAVGEFGDDIVAIRRFAVIVERGGLGERDFLFDRAFELILNESHCFIRGCGFLFFQFFYGDLASKYPHNVLLESIVTWGFFMTLLLTFLFSIGVCKNARSGVVFWWGLFFVLVGMKSGDVVGSWFALAFLYSCAGIGLVSLINAVWHEQIQLKGDFRK